VVIEDVTAEKRSLFQKIFGAVSNKVRQGITYLQVLDGHPPVFTTWGTNPYTTHIVRGAIDAIARNAAKLKPAHIRRVGNDITHLSDQLSWILQVRPNPHMDAYTFLYKVVTTLFNDNNAFIYPAWEGMQLSAIWPINCSRAEFIEDDTKTLYVRFYFAAGQTVTLPYSEVIHLRRHYYKSDFLGESNTPIDSMLTVIHTMYEGVAQAVKTSASLRGILKFQGILKDADIAANRAKFLTDYLTIGSGSSGVATLDSKAEYTPINEEVKVINAAQMKELRDTVYRYFGINEKIIMNTYNEDEWNAFYEGTLEPIAIQMGLEFTAKLFTRNEMSRGNEIIFESNRLQYASVETKYKLLKELMPMGLFTINEGREVLNMAATDGGDKRLISLNYVDAKMQNIYQLGQAPPKGKDPPEDDPEDPPEDDTPKDGE
jgi:HK97 family phage portal protein